MAEEIPSSPTPSPLKSIWATCRRLLSGLSLSRFHTVIGTVAGLASIVGAGFSLVQFVRPANTGDLVAIVQTASSHRSVTDATIEVLTPENAIVATLTPDSAGRVTQELKEGVYVVRVSHPLYAAEVRRVQVMPRQTVEVRASLRAGSSSPREGSPSSIERAVNDGVGAVRRAFRF
jgi:hypothetical protein